VVKLVTIKDGLENDKDKNWNNHENTFEETLRRELVAARATIFLLQKDLEELTKAYYEVLNDKYKRNLQ